MFMKGVSMRRPMAEYRPFSQFDSMLYATIPVDRSSLSALNGSFPVTIVSVIQCGCELEAWYCEKGPGQPSIEIIAGSFRPSISPAYVHPTPRPEYTAAFVPSL